MDKYAEFLRARLDEREKRERAWLKDQKGLPVLSVVALADLAEDSAYVLADIAAKRKILDAYEAGADSWSYDYNGGYDVGLKLAIKALCEPFAEHSRYPGERNG